MSEINEKVCNGEDEAMQIEEVVHVDDGGGDDDEDGTVKSMTRDEGFLMELNLVMIIASLTLSDQELSEVEDMEKLSTSIKQQDVKTLVSKLHGRKRDFDDLKIPNRQATRLQPRILDSRHGRKM